MGSEMCIRDRNRGDREGKREDTAEIKDIEKFRWGDIDDSETTHRVIN